ncbi:hypothetical protein HanRHA438_Chr08g0333751 [Helianthus annuus]|nr:hypothetical protein HanRHA438_Chr08g0333751 [Helianthus annuus]
MPRILLFCRNPVAWTCWIRIWPCGWRCVVPRGLPPWQGGRCRAGRRRSSWRGWRNMCRDTGLFRNTNGCIRCRPMWVRVPVWVLKLRRRWVGEHRRRWLTVVRPPLRLRGKTWLTVGLPFFCRGCFIEC